MSGADLDPIAYEIFFNKLDQILNEGKEVIRYLSGSVITRETGEVLEAFYLPNGQAANIACGILMHFMNVTRVVKYMEENRYEAAGIGIFEGDHFINNDAYIGGMHVPDTSIVAPFFYEGELLGWVAAISHTTETGGIEPGGMCPSALDAWHDGLHFPAVKIVEKGEMRRDVFGMALRGVRDPRGMELDIRARISGNNNVLGMLPGLAKEYGADFFKKATQQMVREGEAQARAKFKALAPGNYTVREYCDSLGKGADKLAVLQVEVEVTEEGDLFIKTPIISPQTPGFNNCYLPAVEATVIYTLLDLVCWDTRWNSGIAVPLHFEIPEGSVLNADASSSVGYCTVGLGSVFCNAMTDIFARAHYVAGKEEEVMASANAMVGSIWGGIDQFGRPCGNVIGSVFMAAGGGARMGKDGHDCTVDMYNPWCYVADFEGEEMLLPLLHLSMTRRPDSGGVGRWRGGSGVYAINVIHKSPAIHPVGLQLGKKISTNQGLYGGYPGPACFHHRVFNTDFHEKAKSGDPLPYIPDQNEIEKLISGEYQKSDMKNISPPAELLKHGDMIVYSNAGGGGGLGDPLDRDPESIAQDIENKLVTIGMAQKIYCVVLDPVTLEVDMEKTREKRADERKTRLERGVPGKEYLKSMVEKREKRDLPQVVLSYLDEISSFCTDFNDQLEAEKNLLNKALKPLVEVKAVKEILSLTPYVKLVEDERGGKVAVCRECGFAFCEASENHKLYCLIYDHDPAEIYPGILAHDSQWCVYREFYCPGCGTQIEVESTPPGTPIIHDVKLKMIDS